MALRALPPCSSRAPSQLADDRIIRNQEERALIRQVRPDLPDGPAEIQHRRVMHWILAQLTASAPTTEGWLPLLPAAISESMNGEESLLMAPIAGWEKPGGGLIAAMSTGSKGAPLVLARTGRNQVALIRGTGVVGGSLNDPARDEQFELGNAEWAKSVMELADGIGHKLQTDPKDEPDSPGSWHACHAEKLLIAFFLNAHVIGPKDLPDDSAAEKALRETKPTGEKMKVRIGFPYVLRPSLRRGRRPRSSSPRTRAATASGSRSKSKTRSGATSTSKWSLVSCTGTAARPTVNKRLLAERVLNS